MARKINGSPIITGLRGNHIAGHGCIEDDYSETSGSKSWKELSFRKSTMVRFPNDNKTPESLNGECVIVQEGRKKDG